MSIKLSQVIKTGLIVLLALFMACTRTSIGGRAGSNYKSEEFASLEKAPRVQPETGGDPGLFFYRNSTTREKVVEFYTEETGVENISLAVLEAAEAQEIAPSLAFALCWVESRYNPYAVNINNQSIDRGLFQLNSRSFPELSENDFYSVSTSSQRGLEYLRYCLDAAENELVALAMYNAGRRRVTVSGAPVSTLEYISQIIEYREQLEERFFNRFMKEPPSRSEYEEIRVAKAVQPRVKTVK